MAMRLTGMMSGMDTESIIQELVAAKRTKVDKATKEQTRLGWKQDAWKSLNAKLQNLQKKYLSNMKYTDAYSKKTTKVSNADVVSVITGEKAINGVQALTVEQLAKSGYLTGNKISAANGGELTALSKVKDINGMFAGMDGEIPATGAFTVKSAKGEVEISINADTTISDVLSQMKAAGVNASFDAKQQRFFISSQKSGLTEDFSITASDANGMQALSALGIRTSLASDNATKEEYARKYNAYQAAAAFESNRAAVLDAKVDEYVVRYMDLKNSLDTEADEGRKADIQKQITEIEKKIQVTQSGNGSYTAVATEALQKEVDDARKATPGYAAAEEFLKGVDKKAAQKADKYLEEYKTLKAALENATLTDGNETRINSRIAEIEEQITVETKVENGVTTYIGATATDKLKAEFWEADKAKAEYAKTVTDAGISAEGATANKINGRNAKITLNGVEFENNDNVFEINGLTLTALKESNEVVSVTTQSDNDGIYGMIKDFLKEYNAIMNEMDKLYNATSAKGYEPLTKDEKKDLSESEIEDWEKKIKDSILRRDSTIGTVSQALRRVMADGVSVNGKQMYLSDFGINMPAYFEAPDNERHAYHIDGDPDDATSSAKPDKLKSMIAGDPDTVVEFFKGLSSQMYTKMNDLSSRVEGYRSFGSFYDDKRMKDDYDSYKSKIADLEKKLTKYEDKWYSRFSAMETSLAKMQSNMSAVTALLGGGGG